MLGQAFFRGGRDVKAWFFVIAGLSILIPCQASTIYVKEGATGIRASWADAYGNFQVLS